MSTSSLPPAWENPRQFSLALPFEVDPLKDLSPHLVCSDTHMVLSYENRVYIHSLPSFALIHTMKTGLLRSFEPIRIHRRMLIVVSEEDDSNLLVSLHIWDLARGKLIGTVKTSGDKFGGSESGSWFGHRIEAQVADLDDNAKQWGRSKDLMLILYCEGSHVLETYVLPDKAEQGLSPMLPVTEIHSVHDIYSLTTLGRTVVTGGFDSTVRVWDVITGDCRLVLMGHADCVSDVCLDKSGLYSTSVDGTTRVWDPHSGDCLQVLKMAHVHSNGIRFLDIASSHAHLITIDHIVKAYGSRVGIWNPITGELMHQIATEHTTMAASTFMLGEQCTLVTLEEEEGLTEEWFRFWDTNSGKIFARFPICGSPKYLLKWRGQRLHWSRGRFFLAIVEEDKQWILKVWDFGAKAIEVSTATYANLEATPVEMGKSTYTGFGTKYGTENPEEDLARSSSSADEEAGGPVLTKKRKKGKGEHSTRRLLESRK
ncbi:hypothetical protein CVT26_015558 [Gymnopilus dilepis]|uniref:Uncharacterized protein n=1 Tax=Gymnopilus dilepis TaxID=231916 RepID=A0A409YDA6_9AGAR|nr:hypothetical protein CVT26_015558 [Gymnopilus dilepis]